MIARAVVVPKSTASPTLLKSFRFKLQDQSLAEGNLYRWENRDFISEHEQTIDGWFLTVCVLFGGGSHHLHQYDTTFFSDEAGTGLKAKPQSSIKPPDGSRPLWKRRSDRWWPVKGGNPLHFIGQFAAAGYAGYLFSDLGVAPLIVAYVDDLGTQDVEDHYDEEAGRDA